LFQSNREIHLLRTSVKALGSALAQQLYATGVAGDQARLPAEPSHVGLTSRLCQQVDIESDWLRHWCGMLRMVPIYHRKVWEDAFVVQALWEAGMLAPGRRGLGFAVGAEWLPAFFAGRGVAVVATDLPQNDSRARGWIASGQHAAASDPLFQPHLVQKDAFDALVQYRAVDMTAIPADLAGQFDFVWSVCAFEHLGSIEAGLTFVQSAMRCLKPGGIAVHTTEFNLNPDGGTLETGGTVLYQRQHLDALAARLAKAGHTMLPIAPVDRLGVLDGFVDVPPYPDPSRPEPMVFPPPPHLRLAIAGYPATSLGLVIQAGG